MPVLQQHYNSKVIPELKTKFGFKNVMAVPKVTKVVINVGYGRHVKENAYIENVERTLTVITGQKPVHTKAKKAISNFKTRVGLPIGISVTLRGRNMYEFLYKLVHITLPRVRDFRGLPPKAFDRRGSYSIGLKEHLAFPEIGSSGVDKIHGLQIVVVTTAKNREEGHALLKAMGFPFRDK